MAGMMRRWVVAVVVMAAAMAAAAQDPLKVFPKNYWVEFANPWIEVIHVRYRAHEKVGVHDHSGSPTLYVYLSDSGPVMFDHAGSDTFDLKRAPLKEGQMRLSPGRIETHHVENLGDLQSDFVRIELKSLPLGMKEFEKRVPAADAAFWAAARPEEVVWDDAHLRVTRLGVKAGQTAALKGVGGRTLWLFVSGDGATVSGQATHAGQAWDAGAVAVQAGGTRVEMVRLDLK